MSTEEKMGFKGPHEPAFPMQSRDGHETFNRPVWGLTKREYFAACALKGILANPELGNEENGPVDCIAASIKLADELIKQLQ